MIELSFDPKVVTRVNESYYCDACNTGMCVVRIAASPGKGFTRRTMRLCWACLDELRTVLRHSDETRVEV